MLIGTGVGLRDPSGRVVATSTSTPTIPMTSPNEHSSWEVISFGES